MAGFRKYAEKPSVSVESGISKVQENPGTRNARLKRAYTSSDTLYYRFSALYNHPVFSNLFRKFIRGYYYLIIASIQAYH
jgi:hypothetical protein